MTVWNLGSINIDHVYRVPHLPGPGETLAAAAYSAGLGGKGANQSVAAARAGARVCHIGAVGPEGGWARDRLAADGIGVDAVAVGPVPTGHAIITVDDAAENSIVLYPGANRALDPAAIAAALADAVPGDTLLLQNETSDQALAARIAQEKGLFVVYSAAPFDVDAVKAVLPYASLLALNAVEAAQLAASFGAVEVPEMLVTRGAEGAEWRAAGGAHAEQPAFRVTPIDTTGAGDTFAGYFAAGRDAGLTPAAALRRAAAAAALQVTRAGAADAIPTAAEVDAFLAGQDLAERV